MFSEGIMKNFLKCSSVDRLPQGDGGSTAVLDRITKEQQQTNAREDAVSVSTLVTKLNHMQDLVDAKELAINQADRLIGDLKNRLLESETENQRVQSLLAEYQERNRESRQCMDQLQAKNVSLSEENKDLNEENRSLKAQVQEVKTSEIQYSNLVHAYHKLCEQLKMLERQQQCLLAERDVLSTKLQGTEHEKKKLNDQFKETAMSRQELVKQAKRRDQELDDLRKRVASFQGELENLQKMKADFDDAQKTLKEKESKSRRLERECSVLRKELEKYRKIVDCISQIACTKEVKS